MRVIERHLTAGFNNRRIMPTGEVLHYISARYTMPEDPFNIDEIIRILEEYRFGYHELHGRDGQVYELVPLPLRAHHAGRSSWRGRSGCNDFMIGSALAGMAPEAHRELCGDEEYFTDRQYDSITARIGSHVSRFHAMRPENIVGHEHVSPGRKVDPGPEFDWQRLRYSIDGFWGPW